MAQVAQRLRAKEEHIRVWDEATQRVIGLPPAEFALQRPGVEWAAPFTFHERILAQLGALFWFHSLARARRGLPAPSHVETMSPEGIAAHYAHEFEKAITSVLSQLPQVYVKKVREIENASDDGLFAGERIRKGRIIALYPGAYEPHQPGEGRDNDYLVSPDDVMGYTIDAFRHRGYGAYANHSRTRANAELVSVPGLYGLPMMCLVALRDIDAREEVLYDYGPGYFRGPGRRRSWSEY